MTGSGWPDARPLAVVVASRASAMAQKESTCNVGDQDPIPGWGRSLEKGMATHSSILAWRIPWTEEPGGLQSMGSPRVRHNLATEQQQQPLREVTPLLLAHTFLYAAMATLYIWRRDIWRRRLPDIY